MATLSLTINKCFPVNIQQTSVPSQRNNVSLYLRHHSYYTSVFSSNGFPFSARYGIHRLSKNQAQLNSETLFSSTPPLPQYSVEIPKDLKFPVGVHQRTKEKWSFQAMVVLMTQSLSSGKPPLTSWERGTLPHWKTSDLSLSSLEHLPPYIGFLFYICAFSTKPEVMRELGYLIISETGNPHNVSDTY